MAFYSVVTVYPDHTSTVDMGTDLPKALQEYYFRNAISNSVSTPAEPVTVRLLRISPDRILDITPTSEGNLS